MSNIKTAYIPFPVRDKAKDCVLKSLKLNHPELQEDEILGVSKRIVGAANDTQQINPQLMEWYLSNDSEDQAIEYIVNICLEWIDDLIKKDALNLLLQKNRLELEIR